MKQNKWTYAVTTTEEFEQYKEWAIESKDVYMDTRYLPAMVNMERSTIKLLLYFVGNMDESNHAPLDKQKVMSDLQMKVSVYYRAFKQLVLLDAVHKHKKIVAVNPFWFVHKGVKELKAEDAGLVNKLD